jgi:hypothetical protein
MVLLSAVPAAAAVGDHIDCADDTDCGAGQACVADGERTSCADVSPTDTHCADDHGCSSTQKCVDDGTGVTVCADVGAFATVECETNSDCGDGRECDNSTCLAAGDANGGGGTCASDDDCSNGQLCAVGGVCKATGGGCQTSAGSPTGLAGLVLLAGLIALVKSQAIRRSTRRLPRGSIRR